MELLATPVVLGDGVVPPKPGPHVFARMLVVDTEVMEPVVLDCHDASYEFIGKSGYLAIKS
jgi:hypothetical protein